MSYLLNLIYILVLAAVSPWLVFCAVFQGKYREGFAEKLLGLVPKRMGDRPCVWLHAVSVGEANLLRTILPKLQANFPNVELVISVTTKAAYEMARKKFAAHTIFYCPLDFSWAVGRALRRVRPDVLLLVELEVWPNLLRAAQRHGVKTAIINGRLSEKSFRGYGRVRWLIGAVLRSLDLIAVQNNEYADRFQKLGADIETLHVTGSLKFDGACLDRDNDEARKLARLAGIRADDVVFLAGSTQHPEEQYALDAYRDLRHEFPRLRLIIVPRHPHRFDEVARRLDQSQIAWQRRSTLDAQGANPQARVLLVDTIGELGAWWATAHIGFVGGSMGQRGGQNMIEPAAYGVAVSFGPNTRNFRDVVESMLATDAARVMHDGPGLTAFVRQCLQDPASMTALGRRAQQLVASQIGAADRTIDLLRALIPAGEQSAKKLDAAA